MTSGTQITRLQRADVPELSRFLTGGFHVPADSFFFSREVLLWKYFDGPGGPSEDSACSLVARANGKIIGHIGICPRQFIVLGDGATPVSTMKAIDLLSPPEHSGLGVFLLLRAFATSKTQYAIGGTVEVQTVLPKLGFEPKPKLTIFNKVLAPLHRLRKADQGLVRKLAGTAKDVATAWRARTPPAQQTVELRSATAFTEEITCLLRQSSVRTVTCQRNHLLLNYFLRCPVSGFSGWTIHTSGRTIGFAVLKITSYGRIQRAKIVDCWLNTEDPSCWQAAVAALLDRLRDISADYVIGYGTTPNLVAALVWNGFTKSEERNVYLRDKQQSLPPGLSLGLSMLEGDHAIM